MKKTQEIKKFHGLLLNSHDIHISKKKPRIGNLRGESLQTTKSLII